MFFWLQNYTKAQRRRCTNTKTHPDRRSGQDHPEKKNRLNKDAQKHKSTELSGDFSFFFTFPLFWRPAQTLHKQRSRKVKNDFPFSPIETGVQAKKPQKLGRANVLLPHNFFFFFRKRGSLSPNSTMSAPSFLLATSTVVISSY